VGKVLETIRSQYDEARRVAALRRLGILDTPREPEYDELVELAAAICEAPISLLSFIDDHRQWYKAAIGVAEPERPLASTFCQYTLHQHELLVVEDTRNDAVLANHPDVVGEPGVRFYAGIALRTVDDLPVGTLCVADFTPRSLSAIQIQALKVLARQAMARLNSRESRSQLQRALAEAELAKDRLAISDARFKAFMDSAPFFGFLKDTEGRFLFYNRLIAERFGITSEAWLGKSDHDLFPSELAAVYRANDVEVLTSGTLRVVDETTVHEDGKTSHWRSYKFPCPDQGGFLLGGISLEITKDVELNVELHRSRAALESANLRLSELATTDALTGLPNRRAFDERLVAEFASARRSLRPLSVMLLDVDHFKQHNDRFGHDAGDDTLRQFAGLLRQAARAEDLVARYGGEEFVLLLPDTEEHQASELGERILRNLRDAVWPIEAITASGGVACITPTTPSQTHLVTLADHALYVAKRSGKDRVVTYTSCSKKRNVEVEIPAVL
jgi:diguanylate cyclase (GGDEF)-like protein/PAS domain S-box-containing protein